MLSISSVRQQYPQYSDMSDQQLADALHAKYYSDMPKDAYYQKIGLGAPQKAPNAAPQQNQSFINELANSPAVNGILGAGDALASTLSAGLVNPRNSSGTAYNVGKVAGNIGGFLGGGEILDTARAGMEAMPYIGQLAKLLGGEGLTGASKFGADAARQGLGTAAYGAVTNPDDRLKGAEEGFAWGVGGATVPPALKGIGMATNVIRPQKFAAQILDILGGGKNLENNAQSIAQDLKNSFENRVAEGNALYSPLFDSLGSHSVYDGIAPSKDSYQSIAKDVIKGYDRNLNKLHQQFVENPSLENAHSLQSQLGSAARDLQAKDSAKNLSVADKSKMQGYLDAREAINGDINNFLSSKNPALAQQYQSATQNWLDNVVPYLENSKISKIAKGDVTNPRNITNIFSNPEPEIQKIVEDMGPNAANKILYAELGKTQGSLTPEKLLNSFNDLEKKGLGSYVTPSLAEQFDTLTGRIKNRDSAQKAAGALLGASLLHPMGSTVAATLGGLGGMAASPAVMKFLQSRLPLNQLSTLLANSAKTAYPPVSKAVIANQVPAN